MQGGMCSDLGAERAERGGESADGRGPAVEDRVSHGEEDEQEEQHSQHVEGQNDKAMWMFQCRAQCRKTHVVTERVTQHRTYQVTWGGGGRKHAENPENDNETSGCAF